MEELHPNLFPMARESMPTRDSLSRLESQGIAAPDKAPIDSALRGSRSHTDDTPLSQGNINLINELEEIVMYFRGCKAPPQAAAASAAIPCSSSN